MLFVKWLGQSPRAFQFDPRITVRSGLNDPFLPKDLQNGINFSRSYHEMSRDLALTQEALALQEFEHSISQVGGSARLYGR